MFLTINLYISQDQLTLEYCVLFSATFVSYEIGIIGCMLHNSIVFFHLFALSCCSVYLNLLVQESIDTA